MTALSILLLFLMAFIKSSDSFVMIQDTFFLSSIGKRNKRQQQHIVFDSCRTPLILTMKMSSASTATTSAQSSLHYNNDPQKAIPSSPQLQNSRRTYLPRRTIRSVDWCGSRGMLPWQKYHVETIYPTPDSTDTTSSSSANGNPSNRSAMMNPNVDDNIDLTKLSRSSKYLLDKFDSLTLDEQRRLYQKMQVEQRASKPLDRKLHYYPIYKDEHIIVVNKPSRVLCVPGPRRNPSLANLVHDICFGSSDDEDGSDDDYYNVDKMVIHRLDMDTSGVVAYALSEGALSKLHDDFRHRQVKKTYQALVCGHVPIAEGEIDLPLERDPMHPPFMRIASMGRDESNSKEEDSKTVIVHEGFQKFIQQAPKPSLTTFRVLSWEYLDNSSSSSTASLSQLPVTRVELTPYTGRTHQLRVHCAGMGHPIVGDDIYGYLGEGAPNAGLDTNTMEELYPQRCTLEVQQQIYEVVQHTNQALCLHAKQLCIHHPISRAPLVFEADPPF